MSNKLLYQFQKNSSEVIRFEKSRFQDRDYLDIRIWYTDEPSDAVQGKDVMWKPTKKGIALSMDLLDEFQEGLTKAIDAIEGKDTKSDESEF